MRSEKSGGPAAERTTKVESVEDPSLSARPGPEGEAPTGDELREIIREAVVEALSEQRGVIQSIVEDALQELALYDARREFEMPERRLSRPPGFRAVDGEA